MITLAVIAKHDAPGFRRLVDRALVHVKEVVVALDEGLEEGIDNYRPDRVRYFHRALAKDFAGQRNFLAEQATQPWVLSLDTDEDLSDWWWANVVDWLESQPEFIEVLLLPRANYIEGVSSRLDDYINWPDWQPKLCRRHVRWVRPVHEWPGGEPKMLQLPCQLEYAILHRKTIARQAAANLLYKEILDAQA